MWKVYAFRWNEQGRIALDDAPAASFETYEEADLWDRAQKFDFFNDNGLPCGYVVAVSREDAECQIVELLTDFAEFIGA